MDIATLTTNALAGTLSHDEVSRTNAESQLRDLLENQEYPIELSHLLRNPEVDMAIRQISGVALRSYVNKKWSLYFSEFKEPPASAETKTVIRGALLQTITDPHKRVRVAAAFVVSKIARAEWPDEWPDLLDNLVLLVQSNDQNAVHGAMRVLTEFVKNDISDDQFVPIAQTLLPDMLKMIQLPIPPSNLRTSSRSVAIFRQCVETLFMIKEEHPSIQEYFMTRVLPSWLQAFVVILGLKDEPLDEESRSNQFLLKTETIKCLNKLISGFSKNVRPFAEELVRPVHELLLSLVSYYLETHVRSDRSYDPNYDSDGNELGIDSLLCECLEFLSLAVEKRLVGNLYVDHTSKLDTTEMHRIFDCIQSYMYITANEEENWSTDVERYVVDEEAESISYNVRIAAQELVAVLIDQYGALSLRVLWSSAQAQLRLSDERRERNDELWWKSQEATYTSLGLSAEALIQAANNNELSSSFAQFLEQRIGKAILETDYPFLQGRANFTASQFASFLPDHVAPHFVEAAVNALEFSQSIPVKISAVRALHKFARNLAKHVVAPYQIRIIQQFAPLVQHTSANTLTLVLDALLAVIDVDGANAAQCEPVTTSLLMEIWYKFPEDPAINSTVAEIFETFAKNPITKELFCHRVIPTFTQALDQVTAEETSPHAIFACGLLSAVVKGCVLPLPTVLTSEVLPSLFRALIKSQDRSLMQEGADVLRGLIIKDTSGFLAQDGARNVVHFIAKLLDPNQPEAGGLFVGDLTIALLRKAHESIRSILPELLGAVARRLDNCHTVTYIQGLIIIFAQLISTGNEQDVVNFLKGIESKYGNGLQALITIWCENFSSFQGAYCLKLSAMAMSRLLTLADPTISCIQVKGDIIIEQDNADRIVTRSFAKQCPDKFEMIPAPVKMFKLLIEDLNNLYEQNIKPTQGETAFAEADDGDDDWEDLDGRDANGESSLTYLSNMLDDNGDLLYDVDDEEDLKTDPIYQMDMLEYLITFFRSSEKNLFGFNEIYRMIKEEERQTLIRIVG